LLTVILKAAISNSTGQRTRNSHKIPLPSLLYYNRLPMKKLYCAFLCCVLAIAGFSQGFDPMKVGKKTMTTYGRAISLAENGKLQDAQSLLKQCIEMEPGFVDAYLSLGGVYSELKDYKQSIALFEKAFAIDADYTIESKLPYSINLARLGQFDKALEAINAYLDKKPPANSNTSKAAEFRKKTYTFAVEYAKQHPVGNYVFNPLNVGDSINTTESEYFPSLTINGSEFVFTRRVGNNEDFYHSKLEGGRWTKATPIPGSVNTEMNEGAQNISQDGNWLVFTGCNRPDGMGSCDLYISRLTPTGWDEATNLGGKVNSDQWDSQPCLSPDKRDLYFSSRRYGGFGGCDIWVCHLQANGRWGEPENLGPSVNTPGDEQCPFIHADNQTLYFTSNYWPGYGDEDIFYAKKGPGGDWSKPTNLGYPINTIDREGTLFVTADGKTAYYASDKIGTKGGLDIYSFELREDLRPAKTLWVSGQVFDKKTIKGLPSEVELTDLATRQIISKVQTDENGKYLITLPVGKNYVFNVNRKGYLFYSDNFMLESNSPDSTYQKDIPLQPIEVNATLVLNNIFFDVNKFDLKPESQIELDKIVQLMNDNPTVKVEISGHTDNMGKPADNLILSDKRAKTVVAYLINKRIAPARFTWKGLGETQPVDDNKTEEGRAKNRRTELKVTAR